MNRPNDPTSCGAPRRAQGESQRQRLGGGQGTKNAELSRQLAYYSDDKTCKVCRSTEHTLQNHHHQHYEESFLFLSSPRDQRDSGLHCKLSGGGELTDSQCKYTGNVVAVARIPEETRENFSGPGVFPPRVAFQFTAPWHSSTGTTVGGSSGRSGGDDNRAARTTAATRRGWTPRNWDSR